MPVGVGISMTKATITRTLARDHPGVRAGRSKERVHDDKITGFYLLMRVDFG